MILKCKSIAHIHNSIEYILRKEKNHELIDFNGIDISNPHNIISDFGFYKNSKVSNGYVSLVISPSPDDKMDAEKFKKVVAVTLKELKLENRQFFAVSHNNTKTPHCHVILNRISFNQETWNDHHIAWKCKEASITVARKLNLKSAGDREIELKKIRAELRNVVREIAGKSNSLSEFRLGLESKGIQLIHEHKKNGSVGTRIQFKNESLKASEVDRMLVFKYVENEIRPSDKLSEIFQSNARKTEITNRFSRNVSKANYDYLRKRFKDSIHFCFTVDEVLEDLKKAGVSFITEIGTDENLVFQLSYKGEFLTSQDLSPMLKVNRLEGELRPSDYLEIVLQNNIDRFDNKRTEKEILADMEQFPDRQDELGNEMLTWYSYQLRQGFSSPLESQSEDNDELNKRRKRRRQNRSM